METRRLGKIGKQMSKAPTNQEVENRPFMLDRREFIMGDAGSGSFTGTRGAEEGDTRSTTRSTRYEP
jgi:hypothetical protein